MSYASDFYTIFGGTAAPEGTPAYKVQANAALATLKLIKSVSDAKIANLLSSDSFAALLSQTKDGFLTAGVLEGFHSQILNEQKIQNALADYTLTINNWLLNAPTTTLPVLPPMPQVLQDYLNSL